MAKYNDPKTGKTIEAKNSKLAKIEFEKLVEVETEPAKKKVKKEKE